MQHVDLIVTGPHFFTMKGEGVGYCGDAAMAVDRGRIVHIGPQAEVLAAFTAERVLDATAHAVLPGFIDAHMHTGLCILRGLAQDTNYWMMYGLGPFSAQVDSAAAAAGSRLAILEGLRAGTTTFGDYGNGMDEVCRFIEQLGARGRITVTVREAVRRVYAPGELYEFDPAYGRTTLAENLEVFDRWHGQAGGRISVLFGPQGPDFGSRELLLEVRRLALERGTRIHMHTQQGDRETAQLMMRYGKRPIAWLDEIGYLDKHLIAVHLTDADEAEAALVARRGAGMILCSGSIGIIDGIVPPAKAFQDAGGSVALGSDQAPGNNCHNIMSEMKLTALFNKIRYANPEVMPAWRVLRMATIEGARAIGLGDEIGSLEPGKRADFILVDLRRPSMLPVFTEPMRNIVPNLVYSARGDEVATVVVDGRVVMENGRILTVDEEAVYTEAQARALPIGPKATPEFARVNGTNAVFMREGKL
ncbi:MAG TPA: amidohydrolase family protein [Symbiobacteriaceae bacterium]|nr:amidohydrolase family protein [Symbiobacteriaceae bacterium]